MAAAVRGRPTTRWWCCSPHRGCLLAAVLLLSTLISIACATRDTLRRGDSIRGEQTLVSAGGVFELGLFSLPASSNCYVGIWYNNNITADRTVVWVANRETPTSGCSGALAVDAFGSVVILDGSSNIVQVLGEVQGSNQVILLDSGNLVVTAAGSNQVVWQSFDYPTDTWLPGMRLGKRPNLTQRLTSWRSPADPSPGAFTLELDGPRLKVMQKETRLWYSGALAAGGLGLQPTFSPWYPNDVIRNFTYYATSYDAPRVEYYFVYDAPPFTRLVMDAQGQLQLRSRGSTVLWAAPGERQKCGDAAYCGANGLCSSGGGSPTCKCLPGFDPRSAGSWAQGTWSDGCSRRLPTKCAGNEFWRVPGVSRPFVEPYNYVSNSSRGCKERCAANCSCTAYALAYTKSLAGCYMWFGDLTGVREENYTAAGRDLYIRLAASELNHTSNATNPKTNTSSAGPAFLIVHLVVQLSGVLCVTFLCFYLCRKCKGGEANSEEQLLLRDIGRDGGATYTFVEVNKVGNERGPEVCVYSFSNVMAATDNFSDDKKLGQGGFGAVYKGKFPDGQEMAIKRLSTRSAQGLQEFKTEILIIARLQHKNLVRLLGCCVHREERLLIYEYMPNKSLDFFLFDPERGAQLDGGKRLQIMEGIAQGLLYLHKYSRLTIIHRDLKASNILLDSEMNPKISDFGMARIFGSNEDKANTNRIVGTYGYMSPEYAMEGRFSVKSDVFSFGVIILEIVSGRKNIGSHHYFPAHGNLLSYAWDLWNAGEELALADPSLGGSWRGREVSRCIHVGLVCVQECADDRPTMAEVVAMLAGESVAHQVPKQPAFFPKRGATPAGGSVPAAASSANGVSMSTMEGR